jgi:hypothetical protein
MGSWAAQLDSHRTLLWESKKGFVTIYLKCSVGSWALRILGYWAALGVLGGPWALRRPLGSWADADLGLLGGPWDIGRPLRLLGPWALGHLGSWALGVPPKEALITAYLAYYIAALSCITKIYVTS